MRRSRRWATWLMRKWRRADDGPAAVCRRSLTTATAGTAVRSCSTASLRTIAHSQRRRQRLTSHPPHATAACTVAIASSVSARLLFTSPLHSRPAPSTSCPTLQASSHHSVSAMSSAAPSSSSSAVSLSSAVLGFPRMGSKRQLKFALESYWSGQSSLQALMATAAALRAAHWQTLQAAGIAVIPSNDFSLYDLMLDHACLFSAIPHSHSHLLPQAATGEAQEVQELNTFLFTYFALARGYQGEQRGLSVDVKALEMKKWLDTNFHQMVPALSRDQSFALHAHVKPLLELREARALGLLTRPVLFSPLTFLLLSNIDGKSAMHCTEAELRPLLLRLLPVYVQLLNALSAEGADWVQLDDPVLTLDLPSFAAELYSLAYHHLRQHCPGVKLQLTTYFASLLNNLQLALSLPIAGLHIDLVRAPEQLQPVLDELPHSSLEQLSLGVIDGRNVWKADLTRTVEMVRSAVAAVAASAPNVRRVLVSSSCSLLHVPHSLDAETRMEPEFRSWLSFAAEKLQELQIVTRAAAVQTVQPELAAMLAQNAAEARSRASSPLIHNAAVQHRVAAISPADLRRQSPFDVRVVKQQERLRLPLLPTTTIGSFPQTAEVRKWRASLAAGRMTAEEYDAKVKAEIAACIRRQEDWGLDVLVDGEFDRSDMVEAFGSRLQGVAFTSGGWVQSYGSRCVKPPIIFGDVHRAQPMTLHYTLYAQSCTPLPVKGILTGPVTCLQWSFVRDDQPRAVTAQQLALAMRDEALDLEAAGIRIIQIDEPAIREGLPLQRAQWAEYLQWSVDAFLLASCGLRDETQLQSHLCYSHFEDCLPAIARMDADVLTIENARADASLLSAFHELPYRNALGPGLYDIHSPRVPSVEEMDARLRLLLQFVSPQRLWVNPDCGLKTRGWQEVEAALRNMVQVAKATRQRPEVLQQ